MVSVVNIRLAFVVVGGVLLAAACSSAPQGAPESATPKEQAATQHVVAGPVGLDVPASWHVRPGMLNPGGDVTFVYLSPIDVPSECQNTSQGGACLSWPVVQLPPGGIVVAVRQHGRPGSQPPAGGEPITVGGQPARRIRGLADEACRAIGGTESIDVVVPSITGSTGWIGLDGCLAGPDVATAEAAFAAMVTSVR